MMSGNLINFNNYKQFMLPTLYQQQTHLTKYSRWRDDLERREYWPETVYRFWDFMSNHTLRNFDYLIPESIQVEIFEGILQLDFMPSMRAMMTAGPALERDHAAAYNCSYAPVDRITTHDEAFYLTMCSCGVGFSVERQYTNQLPLLPDKLTVIDYTVFVEDDKISWAESYRKLLKFLYDGFIPKWNTDAVRPKGSRLITFGGRASGPEPLIDLFNHAVTVFKEAIDNGQRRLTSLQQHDLMTKASDVANSGGVRRGAMIALTNPSDERMRDAKSGEWWNRKPHFRLSNNTAMWTDYPDSTQFLDEWLALIRSQAGERGQANRRALIEQARRVRRIDVDKWGDHYGLNPCGEIILRPRQFCNLTTNIIRAEDGLRQLLNKIRLSTIVGTLQSTLTNFRYLSSEWKFNCEEERLLGVSLNGIFDNRYMAGLDYIREGSYVSDDFVVDGVKVELPDALATMRDMAVAVNKDWADRLGISPSAAITTVKPEGNNSNLVDCRSGLHGAHAKQFYIRTNRANKIDKLAQFMITQGVYAEDDVSSPDTAYVLYFPIRVPEGAISRHDYSAIEHLKIWQLYQQYYCEHKPSVTISVKDREWMSVGAWVYENFDMVSGIAFLPWAGGNYRQAPYMECTEKQFNDLVERTPKIIDWSLFHEDSDYTEQAKELACMGGSCDI
jgi:ribonucleoside-triphosphate reductase (thioredoxin)